MEEETEVSIQVYLRNRKAANSQMEFRETFTIETNSFSDLAQVFSKMHEFFQSIRAGR